MYVAMDAAGKAVSIEHAERDKEYFCPACGERLMQRRGEHRAHHFAHYSATSCCMTSPMTEWHLSWQREFPDECREVVFKDGEEFRRADIACGDLIVEFQHSNITQEMMRERTEFYRKAGKQVWWLFDCKDYAVEDVLECFENRNGLPHYTGFFELPNERFFDGVVSSKRDIVILDFRKVCAVLTSWDTSPDGDGIYNTASVCLVVSRKFVVSMISRNYKLKPFDWNLEGYIEAYEDSFSRCVQHALTVAYPDLALWKVKNNFRMVGKYVLGMDTDSRNIYPALYFVPEKRRQDSFKWWYPYLTMAERKTSADDFEPLKRALWGNTLAYRWFGDDETLSIRRVTVPLALFHVLASV